MSATSRRFGSWVTATFGLLAVVLLAGCAADTTVPVNPPPDPPANQEPGDLTSADVQAWLDGFMPAAMEREGIAGGVVSVVHEGQVVTERGYGYADTGAGGGTPQPVDAQQTLFRVGSITKLTVATAVMQLVEEGQVGLDEPVTDLIDFDIPTTFDEPITLRHLLSHTAGFEERLSGLFLDPSQEVPPLSEVLADPPEQIFAPGTTPAYSNYGIALAGDVVQQVSGLDFVDYADQYIFDPAGMDTATLAQPLPADLAEQMSTGYGDLRSASIPFEHIGMVPAGSMSATAPDMSAFMLAHLAGENDDASSSQVLSPESVATMQQPAFGEQSLGGLANGHGTALGWWEQDRNGHRIVGHAGDTLAFRAELQLYPEEGTGIYIALNSAGVRSESGSALRAQVLHGFADRYFPDTSDAPQVTDTAAEHAEMLAGSYVPTRAVESNFVRSNSVVAPVSITAIGDGTITVAGVIDASGAPMHLVEVEPWVWQEVGGQQRIAVDVTDGQVRVVSIHPAIALQPLPPTLALALPVGFGALVVLAVALIGWPVSALVRRRYRLRAGLSRGQRRLHLAAMLGAILTLLSEAAWAMVTTTLMGAGEPSAGLIRLAQVLTLLGVLGVIPAAGRLVSSVRDRRWWPALCNLTLTLGFAGVAYVAIVGRALSLDITY